MMSDKRDDPAPAQIIVIALAALDWAREYREKEQASGPQEGEAGERWAWYQQGSAAAATHDRACVESELRKLFNLPQDATDE